jgi:hypothetical protein
MKKITVLIILTLCALMLFAGCSGASDAQKPAGSDAVDAQAQATENAEESAEASEPVQTQAAQASALIEPEQLISQEEAQSLLGEPLIGEKTEQPAVGLKSYFYEAADEGSDKYLQISVTQDAFMAEGSANTPQQLYEAICAAFEAEPVSGLGDEAQIIPSGYQIMCDGYYLTVSVGYTNDDAGIMSEASKTAVANLKALLGK